MRWFNTAGPVDPADHYLIPPLSRLDRDKVLGLVRDKKYFVRDLGLVAVDAPLRIANPIYAEVLPRELAWVAQETLDLLPPGT